jgi:hypothetical protein
LSTELAECQRAELQAYADNHKCVDRSYPFLQAKKASKQGLVQTAWHKRSPCFTKALGLKEPQSQWA